MKNTIMDHAIIDSRNQDVSTKVETRIDRLDAEALKPFLSPYLAGGFREDDIVLESVQYSEAHIVGSFRVSHAFLPGGRLFHLSGTMMLNCVAQLAVVFNCLGNRLPRRIDEIYLSKMIVKFRKPVQTMYFPVRMHLENKIIRTQTDFYHVSGDVADGAFIFDLKGAVPRPDAASSSR